ncbi:hypothetical protein Taro_054354, partial [Colocasia esculenta]|nr:hypothetical protein [Colocasia esculenta]
VSLMGNITLTRKGMRRMLRSDHYFDNHCFLICALVVMVEVLPGPACIASAVLLAAVFSLKFPIFGVPAALTGEGLVISTGPCSRGSPPLLPSARGSSSRELSVRRVAEAAVAPCVVSSSESECCELLYLSELRVVLCKFSGSSDLWVAMRTSGSLAGVREVLPKSALCLFRTTVVLPLWFEVCRLVGLCSGEVLPGRLLALLVEVLPKAALCLFLSLLLSLSVEMSCRCFRLDYLCYSLPGHFWSRCCALGYASGCCVGQLVLLFISKFLGCTGGTACPHGSEDSA